MAFGPLSRIRTSRLGRLLGLSGPAWLEPGNAITRAVLSDMDLTLPGLAPVTSTDGKAPAPDAAVLAATESEASRASDRPAGGRDGQRGNGRPRAA